MNNRMSQLNMKTPRDITTTRDCIDFILHRRFACRRIIQLMDAINEENHLDRRLARKLRKTNNPMLARRADTLEAEANRRTETTRKGRDFLLRCGRELMEAALFINAMLPQALILDLLNVNRADRHRVSPSDGIIEIVFIEGLEDSVMQRSSETKDGPLAQAYVWHMCHELKHNEQLKQAADERLFGKGGMFEFLPTYQLSDSGEAVRKPPKLRLVDKCDVIAAQHCN